MSRPDHPSPAVWRAAAVAALVIAAGCGERAPPSSAKNAAAASTLQAEGERQARQSHDQAQQQVEETARQLQQRAEKGLESADK